MSKYIDAEKLKDDVAVLFERNEKLIDEWLANCVDDVIDEQTAADVQEVVKEWCDKRNCIIVAREDFPRLLEVRHGRWVDIPFTARWICSNCDYISEFASFKYCPDCGARMDLEDEE